MVRLARQGLLLLVAVAALLGGIAFDLRDPPARSGGSTFAPIPPPPRFTTERWKIRSGENIASILGNLGLPAQTVLAATRPHYDLARIGVGKEIALTWDRKDPAWRSLSYPIDEDRTLVATTSGDTWTAEVQAVAYEDHPLERRIEIHSSLWASALAVGIRPSDVIRLSELFQWQVDFNTELMDGAVLSLVAEGRFKEGRLFKLGAVHAAILDNGGKRYVSIRHVSPDGKEEYYDLEGMAARRPFLRSPLALMRVTSGFSRARFHPVLKKYRPHLGTDFAAPTGTPVRAVGRGTVVLAANNGGHGLQVRIQHPNGYTSGYSHLSRILVRKGQSVDQGQVVGKVGSTGLSTGPHCHYELVYKGKHIDPLKADLPASEPMPQAERPAFEEEKKRWLPEVERVASGDVRDTTIAPTDDPDPPPPLVEEAEGEPFDPDGGGTDEE